MAAERPKRRLLRWVGIYLGPVLLPLALFAATLALPPAVPFPRREIPRVDARRDHCNWSCHNRGCRHRARLPAALTGDDGLYGATIRGLFRLGAKLHPNRMRGYGLANLLVFCIAWPGVMYALWVVAWRQRAALVARRSR